LFIYLVCRFPAVNKVAGCVCVFVFVLKDKKLIFKGIINPDPCTRGVDIHYWNLFLVHAKGILKMNAFESVHLRWLTKRQMARLRFTPPITYIFKKLKFFLDINVFF